MVTRSKVTAINIENFKSFKKLDTNLGAFNVIVGRNGSGKTNFIEFFKFIRKVTAEEKRPFMPYIDWWNIKNIVWKGEEELPIKGKITLEIEDYEVIYEFTFISIGGKSQIPYEKISFKNIVTFEKEGKTLKIQHDEIFVEKIKKFCEQFQKEFLSLKKNPKLKSSNKEFTTYQTISLI